MENTEEFKYKELTHEIIGCAMEVHNELGSGFLEPLYEEALIRELKSSQLNHETQVKLAVEYKGEPLEKTYRADIIVDDKVLLELKAVKQLSDIDQAQILHYLKSTKLDVGSLINFGADSLEWERFIYSD